jgi:hypothetical protein
MRFCGHYNCCSCNSVSSSCSVLFRNMHSSTEHKCHFQAQLNTHMSDVRLLRTYHCCYCYCCCCFYCCCSCSRKRWCALCCYCCCCCCKVFHCTSCFIAAAVAAAAVVAAAARFQFRSAASRCCAKLVSISALLRCVMYCCVRCCWLLLPLML